jgi:transcription elongation factor GreA
LTPSAQRRRIELVTDYSPRSISDAARLFAQTLAPAQATDAHEAMRFSRWLGEDRPVGDIRPSDVESYVDTFSASAPNAGARADSLKSFLSYAHKQKLMPDRLVTHVRVRKQTNSRSSGDSRTTVVSRNEVQLTAEGIVALTAELGSLKEQRPRIAADLRDAMADKDFRENAPLDAAREAQGQLEARIRELENTLRHAVAIDDRATGDAAQVGSNVVISNLATGSKLSYLLVSSREARPTAGRLSVESPVGQAIVGRRTGDEVEVQAPSGTVRFRVESVQS